jgi:hypothetical protein
LKSADRNIDIMRRYLDSAARQGRSQVAAIGVAQEPQRVFIARQRDTDPSNPPQFSFDKKGEPPHSLPRRESSVRPDHGWIARWRMPTIVCTAAA